MIRKTINLNQKKHHVEKLLRDINISFTVIIEGIGEEYIFNIYSRTQWVSQQFGILTMPEIIDKIMLLIKDTNEFLDESARTVEPSEEDLNEMLKSAYASF